MTRKFIPILIGVIALFPNFMNAQGRGGGGGRAVMRGTAPFSPGRGQGPRTNGVAPGNVNPYFHGARGVQPDLPRRFGYGGGYGYGYGYGSGFPIYPTTIWPTPVPDYGVQPPVEYVQPAPSEPIVIYQNQPISDGELEDEIIRLNRELDALRDARAAPPVPSRVEPNSVPSTPTVLIYKNGQREEIHNYAIAGETLWILDQGASRKIALTNLDLGKTENENRLRGVRFALPSR